MESSSEIVRLSSKKQLETLHVVFEDKNDLLNSFMPFVQNGALFVETKKSYQLGDFINVEVNLFDYSVSWVSKVIWVTPRGAQGGMKMGIGIQLDSSSDKLKDKIKSHLAGLTSLQKKTDTM